MAPTAAFAGPTVRIRFPPALSPLRTSFSGGKRARSAETTRDDPHGEYLKRNRWFESGSLQQGVRARGYTALGRSFGRRDHRNTHHRPFTPHPALKNDPS